MVVVEDEVVERPSEVSEVSAVPDARPRRTIRYWAALAALGLMCLIVTKGPLYWLRIEQAALGGDPIDDVWVQTVFVASAALVLVLAAPAFGVMRSDRVVLAAFGLFGLAMLASSLWSVDTSRTFEQAMMFLVGTAAALTAGAYLRRFDVLVALFVAMHVGVALSVWAWWRDWPGALITYPPHWNWPSQLTGIYFSRNSLGPVAVLGAYTAIVLVAATAWRRSMIPVKVILVAMAGVDLFVLDRTGSVTPVLGTVVAVAAAGTATLMVPGRGARARRVVAGLLMAGTVAFATLFVVARSEVAGWFNRSATFAGRTTIWDVALDFVDERPVGGWGFMAIWKEPEIGEALAARGGPVVFEAHSGYVEVLLGIGVIGLVLLCVVLVTASVRTVAALLCRPGVVSAAWVGLVALAIAMNLSETYVGAILLPWVLLCVATGGAVAVRAHVRSALPPDGAGPDEPGDGIDRDDEGGGPTDGSSYDELPSDVPGGGPSGVSDVFDWSFIDETLGVSFEAEAEGEGET